MAVINHTFFAIGDSEIIDNNTPILGLTSLLGFTDDVTGVTANRYFEKYFQYTLDGLNWSEWLELNEEELQSIQPKNNHLFRIRFKYVRAGSDGSGDLVFNSLTLNGSYVDVNLKPINYSKSNFNKVFDFLNLDTLNWANNVLEKNYKRGIVAKYLERSNNENWSDEDYIDLFWSIIYAVSLVVNYSRDFKNISFDKSLFREYIRQRGLFLNGDRDLIELSYLAENFFDQMRLRGTKGIYTAKNDNVLVDGELLRLIDWHDSLEFIFSLIDDGRSGWVVNKSSPEYKGLFGVTNLIKGYEFTEDFVDLDKYPTYNKIYMSIVDDFVYDRNIKALSISGVPGFGNFSGIYDASVLVEEKTMTIDPNLDYEITFFVKKEDSNPNTRINFGCKNFDKYGNILSPVRINDFSQQTEIFFTNNVLNRNDKYYFVRGIIYNKNESQKSLEDATLNLGQGQNLRFNTNAVKMMPVITVQNLDSVPTGRVLIWDFKVRPLKTKTSRCYLNVRSLFVLFARNMNKEFSNDKVEEIMRRYLLPYNGSLITNWIK